LPASTVLRLSAAGQRAFKTKWLAREEQLSVRRVGCGREPADEAFAPLQMIVRDSAAP